MNKKIVVFVLIGIIVMTISLTILTTTNITEAIAAASSGQASRNVLSTTATKNITTNDNTSTTLKLDLLLHGVGSAGDNPNPDSSLSNKNPLHPRRNFDITIIDSNNQTVKNTTGSIIYNAGSGNFTGTVDLGPSFPTGNYNIKIKSDRYLRKMTPGIINIETMKENNIPQTALVAGDIKTDNVLNVLDYNILRDCGYGEIEPLPLEDPNAVYNTKNCKSHESYRANIDLDDNGIINSPDYNLFLRELSVQNGD